MIVSTSRSSLLVIFTPAKKSASRDGITLLGSLRSSPRFPMTSYVSDRHLKRLQTIPDSTNHPLVSLKNREVTKFRTHGHDSSNCMLFIQAVIKRLMTDVPFGVLLSGGLDSSLVAAVAARHFAGTKAAKRWGTRLHSFCVGLEV